MSEALLAQSAASSSDGSVQLTQLTSMQSISCTGRLPLLFSSISNSAIRSAIMRGMVPLQFRLHGLVYQGWSYAPSGLVSITMRDVWSGNDMNGSNLLETISVYGSNNAGSTVTFTPGTSSINLLNTTSAQCYMAYNGFICVECNQASCIIYLSLYGIQP